MGNFYLIGIDYRDVNKGPIKLERLYARIKPDMVLSNQSQTEFEAMRDVFSSFSRELLQLTEDRPGIEKLMESMSVHFGFEVLQNIEYAKREQVQHHFVGMRRPMSERECLAFTNHLEFVLNYVGNVGVTKHLLETLDGMRGYNPTDEEVEQAWNMYMTLERTLRNELVVLMRRANGSYGRSAKYTEERVRELYDPSKVIAFPLGMGHATDSLTKSTLYSRIKDLKPERIPLI